MTTTPTKLAKMPVPAALRRSANGMTTGSPPTQPRLDISAGRSGSSIAQMTHANSDLVVEIWGTQSREGVDERHLDVLDDERREQLTFRQRNPRAGTR